MIRLRRGDRTLEVTVEGDGGATLQDDGRTYCATGLAHGLAAMLPGGARAQEVGFEVDGRLRRALVVRRGERILVAVGAQTFVFDTGEAAARGAAGHAGSGMVTTPMPGKVTAVRVAPGDRVEPGTVLLVLEAMKMETTLVAEVGGTVRRIDAAVGAMVEAGAVLVEIATE